MVQIALGFVCTHVMSYLHTDEGALDPILHASQETTAHVNCRALPALVQQPQSMRLQSGGPRFQGPASILHSSGSTASRWD